MLLRADPITVLVAALIALGFVAMCLGGCTTRSDPTWAPLTKELHQRYGQGR